MLDSDFQPEWFARIDKIAELLDCSPRKVEYLVEAGFLDGLHNGRLRRVTGSILRPLLRVHEVPGRPEGEGVLMTIAKGNPRASGRALGFENCHVVNREVTRDG